MLPSQSQIDSKVFLEVKAKDDEGIGHKFRLVSTPLAITNLMTDGKNHGQITDRQLLQDIHLLRQLYDEGLKPRMYIYYDRFSMKEKETIEAMPTIKFVLPLTKI